LASSQQNASKNPEESIVSNTAGRTSAIAVTPYFAEVMFNPEFEQ